MFDCILLWDKVMTVEERKELLETTWACDSDDRTNNESMNLTSSMNADNMDEARRSKLCQALTLSTRTLYFMKRFKKLERKIETQWNKLRKMNDGQWLIELNILPDGVAANNVNVEYKDLSFTVKHLLRASYVPTTNRFEPLTIFGTYSPEMGGL